MDTLVVCLGKRRRIVNPAWVNVSLPTAAMILMRTVYTTAACIISVSANPGMVHAGYVARKAFPQVSTKVISLGAAALVLWRRGNPRFGEEIATLAGERSLAMTDLGNG